MRPFIHDRYAALSFKSGALGDATSRPGVKSWVPTADARRLAAYQLLAAYCDNVSRYYQPEQQWSLTRDQALAGVRPAAEKYREYGHAERLVVGARTAVLGNRQTLHIPGAEPDEQDGTTPNPETIAAQAALAYLTDWAVKERLWLEMAEAEHDTVALGDAVWTLYWDSEKGRPRIRTYDPGFYFPVLDAGADNDFTERLHLAWEETFPETGRVDLHRMTWSLDRIRPAQDPAEPFTGVHFLHTDAGVPVPQPGDRVTHDGVLVRDYPWNTEPSTVTCHFTHAVWDIKNVKGQLFDLDPRLASYETGGDGLPLREKDLRLDFIPVLHVPNTPSRREHFGRSILTLVAQILDDLAGNDTDLVENGALAGSATLVTKGGPAGDLDIAGPGGRLDLPVGASAEYLDISKNLDALIKLKNVLKDDLSENSRISKATLGRTDGSNTVSGLQLALSFSPTEALAEELRAVREEKYPLLLRFVLRMAQAAGQLAAGPTPAALVQFGSFQPADKVQAMTVVTAGLKGKAMSTHTAVLYLQENGFPIDDAQAEVERIQHENHAAAVLLLDALGDDQLVANYLGLTLPALGAPPTPPVVQ